MTGTNYLADVLTSTGEIDPARLHAITRQINNRSQLPQRSGYTRYLWGEGQSTIVRYRAGQVLQCLRLHPIFAASPLRLSDTVRLLRQDGVPILTEMFTKSDGDESISYGVYYLASHVFRADELEAA